MFEIKLESGDLGERIDSLLARKIDGLSRSRAQVLVKEGKVKFAGKTVEKVNFSPKEEGVIKVDLADLEVKPLVIVSEDINLNIIAETEDFWVIDKPAGLVVHPSKDGQNITGTLVNALHHELGKSVWPDYLRPGIVHRLDKDTSGLLVVAKRPEVAENLIAQFKGRLVKKKYLALVEGKMEHKAGVIKLPIGRNPVNRKKMAILDVGGKEAVSEYKVLGEFTDDAKTYSYIEVNILTGRTHQIRVHMAAVGHPVVGDALYGRKSTELSRQFLHSAKLAFKDTKKPNSVVSYESGLPLELSTFLEGLTKL